MTSNNSLLAPPSYTAGHAPLPAAQDQKVMDDRVKELEAQLAQARVEAHESEQQRELDRMPRPPSYTSLAPTSRSPSPLPSSSRSPSPLPDLRHQLPLPIVLPQTSKSFKGAFYSPFVRAYAPELEAHNITQSDFLTFIDGLNEAFIAHPIYQGVSVAGMIMQQFIGVIPVQVAGLGLTVGAGVASAATSYARTKAYVKATNANLFHPSGLHLRIRTTKDMMDIVGHPDERLSLPALETNDQLDLHPTATNSDGTCKVSQTTHEDPRMRRIRALKGYVLPLDFNVPDAVSPDNLLKKMGHRQAKRQAKKQEERMDKRREKALDKKDEKLDKADDKITDVEKDLAKERRKMEKDLSKSKAQKDPKEYRKVTREFEKKEAELSRKLERAHNKKDREIAKVGDRHEVTLPKAEKKEEKHANKIRWVVITRWDGEEGSSVDEGSEEEVREELEEAERRDSLLDNGKSH